MNGTLKKHLPHSGLTPWIAIPLLLALTGCEKQAAVVGAVLPLSGPDAAVGEAAQRGLEASFATLEGTPIELQIVDSKSDPRAAADAAASLIDQGAVALIGGVTPTEARSLADAVSPRERVLILTSASEQRLSRDSKWVYRLAAADGEAGATFATFGARRLKAKTAAILATDAEYAQAVETGFKPTFASLDGELVGSFEADAESLGAGAAEVLALSPDLTVLSGDAAWQQAAADRLREDGYRGHLFATRHVAHPGLVDALAPVKDVLFAHSGFDPATASDGAQSFLDGYQAHHGGEPAPVTAQIAAEAWDAVQVLDLALRDRPTMASEIRRGLRDRIKSYPGASGSLEFDDTGAVTAFPRVYSLTADGELRDHGAFLDEKERRIAEERRALKEKLQNLQSQMSSSAGG